MRRAHPDPAQWPNSFVRRNCYQENEIQRIWENTISQIISYQEGCAAALARGTVADYVLAHAREDYRGDVLLAA